MAFTIINIDNLDGSGIISDINPQDLPNNAFSSGNNIRFFHKSVQKTEGHQQVFGTPTITPWWLLPVQTPTASFWVYPGQTKVYVTDGSLHYNITRQTAAVDVDYSSSADIGWNGGVIGGVPVLNNGVDDPQMWVPAQTSQKLQSLTYDSSNTWSDKGYKASVIRPYRDFLVAIDLTIGGTRYSRLVKWSTSAVTGTVPSTWDETDATEDAGEYDISQTNGDCIDMLTLRDINIIYKDDSTWAMQYIGGPDVFRFYQIFGDSGILTRRCVKEFDGKHFVVTGGDIIIHDGIQKNSVVTDRVREEIFNAIDSTNYQKSFVVPNYAESEMWVCIPSTGQTYPDHAHIWNWKRNTWTKRDLPSAYHIAYGIINDSGANVTWDSDSDVWDSDTSVWDESTFNPTDRKLLMAATNLYELDVTTQFAGTNFEAVVERTGLHFGEIDKIKHVKTVWLRTTGNGTFTFRLGYQMGQNDAVTWGAPSTYTFGSTYKIDTRISGKYIAYKIDSTNSSTWAIHNIGFELRLSGEN